mgnify:FL=1
MRDESTKIIDDLISVCKEVQPDLNAPDGSITALYKRTSFEHLFKTIGELYHTLVCFNIPTKYLTIEVAYPIVKITLDYKGMKILCPVYDEEEEEGEKNK